MYGISRLCFFPSLLFSILFSTLLHSITLEQIEEAAPQTSNKSTQKPGVTKVTAEVRSSVSCLVYTINS